MTAAPPQLVVEAISPLNWPKPPQSQLQNESKITLQCAGSSFLKFHSRRFNRVNHTSSLHHSSSTASLLSTTSAASTDVDASGKKKKKPKDLFKLFQQGKLEKLSHYDILNVPMSITPDHLKRAYHKACLQYHPDKTGRGEEDQVFLAIKAAFDTLSDSEKRRAYDSTVDFDDSIPPENVLADKFYKVYKPVFERNLRFAVVPGVHNADGGGGNDNTNKKKGGGKKKKKKNNKNSNNQSQDKQEPKKHVFPEFGDDSTSIQKVNEFYDYWTHFDSWRDFTLTATKTTDHDVEAADCREEKRWMAKEIDRKARALKREELARINLLVERAMAADPRLKRHRDQEKQAKESAIQEKKKREEEEARVKQAEEERIQQEKQKREEEEKLTKTTEKAKKEKHKKALRKAKQLLRKLTLQVYNSDTDELWDGLEHMNDDIEFICDKCQLEIIESLTDALQEQQQEGLAIVKQCVSDTKNGVQETNLQLIAKRNKLRKEAAAKEAKKKEESACRPWSKEELSALAKAVKKYPPGGANRWETIAIFINNMLALEEPRTKDECITQYNTIVSNAATPTTKAASADAAPAAAAPATSPSDWTEEQDRQLQEGLKKFPNTLDKNLRWMSIAKGVDGKGKKECVQRFKAIREAVKAKK